MLVDMFCSCCNSGVLQAGNYSLLSLKDNYISGVRGNIQNHELNKRILVLFP